MPIALLTLSTSCAAPEAIAGFAGQAAQASTQGSFIFRDLYDSCVRRHSAVESETPLFMPDALAKPPSGGDNEPVCAAFKPQGDALAAAAATLATYFQAMHQLASFDNSAVTGNAELASANAATTTNLSASQIDSISKLSGLVTRAFTGHYQRSRLFEYLREADPHVASLTGGLEDVLRKDYPGLLAEERRNLNIRYQRVASPGNPALVLLLNRAYQDDINELERRAKVALVYADALSQIRQAHLQLANEAGHLSDRQLSVALRPHLAKLEALAPELVKTF